LVEEFAWLLGEFDVVVVEPDVGVVLLLVEVDDRKSNIVARAGSDQPFAGLFEVAPPFALSNV